MQTVTKRDICEKVARKTTQTQSTVKEIVQTFLDEVISELSQGRRIELRNFGVLKVRQRGPRNGQNPKDGTDIFVPAKKVAAFKASKLMKDTIGNSDIIS